MELRWARRGRFFKATTGIIGAAVLMALSSGAGAQPVPGNNPGAGALTNAAVATLLAAEHVPGELLVRFEPGLNNAQATNVLSTVAAQEIRRYRSISGLRHIKVSDDLGEALQSLAGSPGVRYAEPNYIVQALEDNRTPGVEYVPSDPRYPLLWGLNNSGQTFGTPDADIDGPEGWDVDRTAAEIIVADIDTGVDISHPDLAANIWTNAGEIPGNGIDDDSNGFIDDVVGWDCINNDNNPFDDHGHGTHTSGTIGMVEGNGTGGVGVAHTVQIMALKFLSAGGSGSTADAIECIDYSTMMGAHVSNNSWGGGGFSQALLDSIEAFGVGGGVFVAASGNSSRNTDLVPHYPSSYQPPSGNVISVAATDHNDQLASFSNFGVVSVDLGAPGVNIDSTIPGGAYTALQGTSMATPHVAGAAALYLSQWPDAQPCEVLEAMVQSAEGVPSLAGRVVSGGRLHLPSLLETAPPECGGGGGGGGCNVNVLAWKTPFADLTIGGEYENAVNAIRAGNPQASITEVASNDPVDITNSLAGQDVFFVPEMELASNPALLAIGAAIASDLQDFVDGGGVVIFAEEAGPSLGFITSTGLMDVDSISRSFAPVQVGVVEPLHAVMDGIPSPFTGPNATSWYTLNEPSAEKLAENQATGGSVVAVKQIGAGTVVQIGFDYFSTNPQTEQILVNAVGLACGGTPSPPPSTACGSVLLYDQNTRHMHAISAMNNLGIEFQRATSSDFVSLAQSQSWDLIIMDFPSNHPIGDWETEVVDHISDDGKVILSYWDLDLATGLQTALEVVTHGEETSPTAQVSPWIAGDSFWNVPNDLSGGFAGDGHNHWGDKGDHLSTTGSAVALGGFSGAPAPNDAAVVLGNDGRTLVIGYLVDLLADDASGNGMADGVDVIENAVSELCEGGGAQRLYVNNNVVGTNSVTGYSVEADGSLTTVPGSPFPTGGSSNGFSADVDSIDASGDGLCLWASNASPASVSAFSIAPDGALSPVGTVSTGGTSATAVAADDVNDRVFVANFSSNTIAVYDSQPDCSLVSSGIFSVSPARTPLDLEVSSDGTKLFASCDFSNEVSVFDISAGGILSHIPGSPFPAGGVQHGLTRSPDESLLYVTDLAPNTVSGYSIGAGGFLTPVPGGRFPVGFGPIEALVSPNNDLLIVSNNQSRDLSVFDINPNGSLSLAGVFPTDDPTQGPAGLAMDQGNHLFQVNGGFASPAGEIASESAGGDPVEIVPGGFGTATVSVYDVDAGGNLTPVPGSPFDTGVFSRPTGVVLVGQFAPPSCDPVTELRVNSPAVPFHGFTDVTVTTSAGLTVGSTDVVMHFDPALFQAESVESSTLSNFFASIDNVEGTVLTASAAFPQDVLSPGAPLFTAVFTTADGALPGESAPVTLSDGDGVSCDDLAGPVPPIPPESLPYDIDPGDVVVGALGDVDCDGALTPVDAAVVLGLFVRTISDGDLPPPCSDAPHRLDVGDWDMDTGLTPIDASVDLGVFVGAIDPSCTPLGVFLGLPCAGGELSIGLGLEDAVVQATLTVRQENSRRYAKVAIAVTTDSPLELGATGLTLAFDSGKLAVVSVESSLEGFTYSVDPEAGLIRTASAGTGQSFAAGEALMSVNFRVKANAPRELAAVALTDADGEGWHLLAGPARSDQMPDRILVDAVAGGVLVVKPACGLGFEFALLLPLVMAAHRRTRRAKS